MAPLKITRHLIHTLATKCFEVCGRAQRGIVTGTYPNPNSHRGALKIPSLAFAHRQMGAPGWVFRGKDGSIGG